MKGLSAGEQLLRFQRELAKAENVKDIIKPRQSPIKRAAIGAVVVASAVGVGWWLHGSSEGHVANSPVIYPGHIAQDAADCPAVGSGRQTVKLGFPNGQPMSDYQAYEQLSATAVVYGGSFCTVHAFMAEVALLNSDNVLPHASLASGTYVVPYAVEPK